MVVLRLWFNGACVVEVHQAGDTWDRFWAVVEATGGRRTHTFQSVTQSGQIESAVEALGALPSHPARPDSVNEHARSLIGVQLLDAAGFREWLYDDPDVHANAQDRGFLAAVDAIVGPESVPLVCRRRREMN